MRNDNIELADIAEEKIEPVIHASSHLSTPNLSQWAIDNLHLSQWAIDNLPPPAQWANDIEGETAEEKVDLVIHPTAHLSDAHLANHVEEFDDDAAALDRWINPSEESRRSCGQQTCSVFTVLICLWGFLLSLKLLGTGFKLLGGKDSAKMFDIVDNPLSGVMLGILATVLLQSSSSTTSMIVSAVGAGELSLKNAVPMVMGANIGTTVTNTLVTLLSIKKREAYRRSFASATVHDLFNYLTVLVLLPFQWWTNFLVLMTEAMTKNYNPCKNDCNTWANPLSFFVDPVANAIAKPNSKVLKAIVEGNCSETTLCDQRLLKSGLLHTWGMSDQGAGITCTVSSIVMLYISLYFMVRNLRNAMGGRVARILKKSLDYNPYLTMMIGCLMTILVQSSSVTTSALVPLCADGLISLEEMFPLTLGANIGTTVTGLLAASMASSYPNEAMQTALAHLLFNLIGVSLAYPIKPVRNKILDGARWLGEKAKAHKWFPICYTLLAFVALPLAGWGISELVENEIAPRL